MAIIFNYIADYALNSIRIIYRNDYSLVPQLLFVGVWHIEVKSKMVFNLNILINNIATCFWYSAADEN